MSNTKATTHQEDNLQRRLFKKVISQFNSKREALDSLSQLLNASKSSIYRKVSGQSSLKPDELAKVVKYYKLSFDEIINIRSDLYIFSVAEGISEFEESSEQTFFQQLFSNLQNTPDAVIYFTGREIPIFHFMESPALMYFKEYVWTRAKTNNLQEFSVIDFSSIHHAFKKKYQDIAQFYMRYQTIEIWDTMGITALLEQIRHYFELGILLLDDAKRLIREITRILDELEIKLEKGSKLADETQENLQVYFSQIPAPGWFYYVKSNDLNYVQTILDPPNSLVNTHPNICQKAQRRFDAELEQSYLISKSGSIQRKKLFRIYKKQITRLQNEIELHEDW